MCGQDRAIFDLATEHRIAFLSIDRFYRRGTENNITRSGPSAIDSGRSFPNRELKHLNLDCAGDQLNFDFPTQNHASFEFEGSNHSQKRKRTESGRVQTHFKPAG